MLAGSLFLLASCGGDDPISNRQKAVKKLYRHKTVKIAVVDSFNENGECSWEAAVLAQEKINSKKLCPATIELVKFDDGGTPHSGTKKAYEIASDNEICAVLGHTYSDISLPCSLIYQYYGLLVFNYISSSNALTARKNPLLFSNMPNDTAFGTEIAQLCQRNGYERILIYYLDNAWGTDVANNVEISCLKQNISVENRDSFDATVTSHILARAARRWKHNFTFDAIFLADRMPHIPAVIEAIREADIKVPVLGVDTFDDARFAAQLPSTEYNRIYAVSNLNLESQNPRFQEFYDDFVERYGQDPDKHSVQIYDALIVLAKAIAEAKSAVPDDIADALMDHQWNEAVGSYYFGPNGEAMNLHLTPKVYRNGKFENLSMK